MEKTAVLLINLGTPDSPDPKAVRRYLTQFLLDERVIDIPWFQRQLLVRGFIVPKRYKESAENYARIWTEKGSPLLYWGEKVTDLLQSRLGREYHVELAMRYQNPSIHSALEKIREYQKIIILPLFPQYASATTSSVHREVMRVVSNWLIIPELHFINSFPANAHMIQAFCENGRSFQPHLYDHILFSYHGLPERQLKKIDPFDYCLKEDNCCSNPCRKNRHCYCAQCHATTNAIAAGLNLNPEQYSICYQSRLGKEPWVQPFTSDALQQLIAKGKKRVLVFSPAFVCDCLETLDEIGNEYRKEFLSLGGEQFDLVPGLNDHPFWIDALEELVKKKD